MKKIFTYFGIFLSVVLMGALSSCKMQEIDPTADLGLNIKVFSPTKVVAGQPMTINGTGFSKVKEIVFPNDLSVTSFELVSNEMIRVVAPAGISAEGGNLILRTENEQVESKLPVTLGNTVISGYSKQEGEEVEGGEQITIYGKDLEFINAIELLDAEGNPNRISHADFYRKGTSTTIIIVPAKNIYEGTFKGKVFTYDGKTFEMPELTYKPKKESGHWEKVKTMLWENTDGTPIPSWGGTFRFGLEGADGNNECIHTFPADQWATIKDGTVRVAVEISGSSNIRITTGWWSAAYGGTEHNCLDMVQEDEDGTTYIELNIKEEGSLYDLIDQQHLLFTGDQYTLLAIYTEEEVWVEGEEGHWERTSYWKNEDGTPIPSWGGTFRFSSEEAKSGEEIYAFPMDVWSIIKDGTVRVAVDVTESSNIRITTGWWTGAYGGNDHNCLDMVQEDEDGTKYIELNIKEEGNLYDNIDVQHLLFTGDAYTLLEIYNEVWVEGEGGGSSEQVIWEGDGSAGAVSWSGAYRFCLEGHDSNNECIAEFSQDIWDRLKTETFYMDIDSENPQVRATTGWWSGQWPATDIQPDNENAIYLTDNGEGKWTVEFNIAESDIISLLDEQHLLFTGDRFTPKRIYFK